jgi:HicA-like toxin of HicAB toxin-antitoxin system
MADYYRDVIRLLRDSSYEWKRQGRGDHEIWWNPKTGVHVTVDRKLKSKFTANGILKRGGPAKGLLSFVRDSLNQFPGSSVNSSCGAETPRSA